LKLQTRSAISAAIQQLVTFIVGLGLVIVTNVSSVTAYSDLSIFAALAWVNG
jgi:hypothetical protein